MEDIRILYVDDSRTAHRLLEKGVNQIAEFSAASSLEEARQLIQKETFTFFILDDELPDGSGLDLAKEIRTDPRHSQTPILLYTASLNNDLAYRAMQAGINDSLPKPTNMIDMRQRIVSLVELPQVKVVRRELVNLSCFYWQADGLCHAYSPDLNLHIQGESQEVLEDRMQTILEAGLRAKADPGQYPADIHTVRHLVRLNIKEKESA